MDQTTTTAAEPTLVDVRIADPEVTAVNVAGTGYDVDGGLVHVDEDLVDEFLALVPGSSLATDEPAAADEHVDADQKDVAETDVAETDVAETDVAETDVADSDTAAADVVDETTNKAKPEPPTTSPTGKRAARKRATPASS